MHKHNWKIEEVMDLFALPFNDLLYKAHCIHRASHDPNGVQVSTLLSIKTGSCPEDCAYCPQSAHYNTGLQKERLISIKKVTESAELARKNGASRFCMGAAWKHPTDKDLDMVIEMVQAVKREGLESCATLGMLTLDQAKRLADAGLDYYNHNLDTSPEFYGNIITTRIYKDRLDTLSFVRKAGINVCSGGIIGMGETIKDRANLLIQLSNQKKHPESVPINMLVQVKGTPLYGVEKIAALDFIKTIAVARILMPKSFVRLSAGREEMTEETQALCFFAGANSIFYGEKLLTTTNPTEEKDKIMLDRLGMHCIAP